MNFTWAFEASEARNQKRGFKSDRTRRDDFPGPCQKVLLASSGVTLGSGGLDPPDQGRREGGHRGLPADRGPDWSAVHPEGLRAGESSFLQSSSFDLFSLPEFLDLKLFGKTSSGVNSKRLDLCWPIHSGSEFWLSLCRFPCV